ncbi:PREDICTED: transcription factor bHLH130-like isoform X2 [Lupinus angustifolius]|uniref:transcription factor bHLH130-like isoform X2 n=1 Tax=Lupinus angustifolius TaxID=3871 RepID=UPI00092F265D|nr:PREDICTED: transcription factor bHLH130-like isoform X2 [Lupinus angustifolius]
MLQNLSTKRNPEMDYPQQHSHQYNSGSLVTSLVENNNNNGCINEETFRSENHHQHYTPSTTSSEMETMFAKLIASPSNNRLSNSELLHHEFGGGKTVKEETGDSVSQKPQHNNNGYTYGSQAQLVYQSQQIQGLRNGSVGAVNAFDGSFSAVTSMDSENSTQTKMGSNLIRQKSSPAGFFNNYSVDNGHVASRDVGSFRACDVSNGQATTTSTSGLHGTLNFTSKMPQISENGNEDLEANYFKSRSIGNDNNNSECYMPSFTNDFWDGSAFNAQKKANNNGEIMFSISNAMETQDEDFGYQKHGLTHHMSLPSSIKMSGMEKLYQIQGSVPWKIRAKRGFATHPRSIAERERRTRISSRMKKLQDLFPKSDKQTNTADMLDLAVQYIKDLKKQVKILTNTKAKCICPSN